MDMESSFWAHAHSTLLVDEGFFLPLSLVFGMQFSQTLFWFEIWEKQQEDTYCV